MRKNFVKSMLLTIVITAFICIDVFAADSAVISGYGYTVNGSVADTSASASVVGQGSNTANAMIESKFRTQDNKIIAAVNVSGTPYVYLSLSAAQAQNGNVYDKWKFYTARASGKLATTSRIYTRWMYN